MLSATPDAGAREGMVPSNVHEKITVRKKYEFFCTFIFDILVDEELFVDILSLNFREDVRLSYYSEGCQQCLNRTFKQGDTRHGGRVGAGCVFGGKTCSE